MTHRGDWNPKTYLSFAALRERPAQELLARIYLDKPHSVIDLGCGPGNSTAYLRDRFPRTRLTGLDSSPAMLAKARDSGVAATWIEAEISAWEPQEPQGLIYSNAALHWVADHPTLMPRLLGFVSDQGALAVQMPRNFGAPSHVLLKETALEGPWKTDLEDLYGPPPVSEMQVYHSLLSPSAAAVDAWETTYVQRLTGDDAVLNWVRGSALTPVRERLSPEAYAEFEGQYGGKLRKAYPRQADGTTLFPFTRVFFVAYRS